MANTLTALAPVLYSAARIVPREITGFLGSVNTNFDDKGVAKGDTVKVPVVPTLSTSSVTPSQTFTVGADLTPTTRNLTLNQQDQAHWHYTAEEERSLFNGGTMADVFKQTVEQGFRQLINLVEARVATIADTSATRGRGTAGTNPFASDLDNLSLMNKVLTDLGCPQDQRSLIINTTAGKELRDRLTVGFLAGAQLRGEVQTGEILNLHGFSIKESAQVVSHVAGTGANYLVNGALVAGDTTVTVDTGTGTILAGDMVGFAASTDYYGVKTALSGSDFVLQDPGLAGAVADNAAVAVVGNHTANIALHRNAVVAVVRPSLQPEGAIADQMVISDPVTGLSCLMLRVPGNALTSYYMRIVYDAFAPNPEFIVKLIG